MTLNSNTILSKLKRRFLKHIWLARAALILGIVALGVLFALVVNLIFTTFEAKRYFGLLGNFLFPSSKVVKIIDGKINILVLGKGGKGHEAPDLTDTIVFVSIDTENKKVTSISIPRDVWIPDLRAKINSAYYWGNSKAKGGGLILAKSTVEEIVGQPISYAVVLDFSSFKEVVDGVGGININVERAFTDNKFPIPGRENDTCNEDTALKCRYETVTFKEGLQFMNGETALKFVRSRNAEGDEGTDLARDARQQKVISAIKEKLLSPGVILNPVRIKSLIKIAETYIETDISEFEAAAIARYGLSSSSNIKSYVLPEEFLLNPPKTKTYDNLYVFTPVGGSWDKFQEWVRATIN